MATFGPKFSRGSSESKRNLLWCLLFCLSAFSLVACLTCINMQIHSLSQQVKDLTISKQIGDSKLNQLRIEAVHLNHQINFLSQTLLDHQRETSTDQIKELNHTYEELRTGLLNNSELILNINGIQNQITHQQENDEDFKRLIHLYIKDFTSEIMKLKTQEPRQLKDLKAFIELYIQDFTSELMSLGSLQEQNREQISLLAKSLESLKQNNSKDVLTNKSVSQNKSNLLFKGDSIPMSTKITALMIQEDLQDQKQLDLIKAKSSRKQSDERRVTEKNYDSNINPLKSYQFMLEGKTAVVKFSNTVLNYTKSLRSDLALNESFNSKNIQSNAQVKGGLDKSVVLSAKNDLKENKPQLSKDVVSIMNQIQSLLEVLVVKASSIEVMSQKEIITGLKALEKIYFQLDVLVIEKLSEASRDMPELKKWLENLYKPSKSNFISLLELTAYKNRRLTKKDRELFGSHLRGFLDSIQNLKYSFNKIDNE